MLVLTPSLSLTLSVSLILFSSRFWRSYLSFSLSLVGVRSSAMPDDAAKSDVLLTVVGQRFLSLIVPIAVTVLLVVWSVLNLTPIYALADVNPSFLVVNEDSQDNSTKKLGASIANALALVGLVVATTVLILFLYKCRLLFIVYGWLLVSAGSAFFVLAWIWFDLVFAFYQLPYENVCATLFIWNLGVGGLVSVFYYAPPLITQCYLVLISVVLAWSLTSLPEWSTWSILFFIAIYDVVAVLTPRGPLRLLLDAASERREPIPGFIYDSASVQSEQRPPPAPPQDERRQKLSGVRAPTAPFTWTIVNSSPFKLGIGDFIFYSLLVGKAATFGFMPWTFAFVVILSGMIGTLISLLTFRDLLHALPALPISVFCALLVLLLTRLVVADFSFFMNSVALPL